MPPDALSLLPFYNLLFFISFFPFLPHLRCTVCTGLRFFSRMKLVSTGAFPFPFVASSPLYLSCQALLPPPFPFIADCPAVLHSSGSPQRLASFFFLPLAFSHSERSVRFFRFKATVLACTFRRTYLRSPTRRSWFSLVFFSFPTSSMRYALPPPLTPPLPPPPLYRSGSSNVVPVLISPSSFFLFPRFLLSISNNDTPPWRQRTFDAFHSPGSTSLSFVSFLPPPHSDMVR